MKRSPLKPRIVRNRRLRAQVFERDQGICVVCKRYDAKWVHDHIVELWEGGADTLENSQTLCRRHNLAKTTAKIPERAKTDRLRERSDLTRKRRAIIREKEETGS